jgi:hypothetical protein
MALHEIVYVSLASESMSSQQLQTLLAWCRHENEKSQVTGVLVYHQREFLQLLEGEADVVTTLFAKIEFDQRHQQVYKLWDGPICERSYAHWSMAFVDQAMIETLPQAVQPSWFSQGLARSVKDSTGKKLLLRLRDEFLLRHGEFG